MFLAYAVGGMAQTMPHVRTLDEVVVTTRRPLGEIGIQKTSLDSVALKESIALSMADILMYNSALFVKSYGRATQSTVAFRGTSPGHTQVTWNGMRINSPMAGSTDFSTIPAFFVDRAQLLHGTSSVNESGGGLGGAIKLGTEPQQQAGFHAQYIQGIGSFSTFDEFLRLGWADEHWSTSTRAVYSSSPNDYHYTNHDKKVNIHDDKHNIIGYYHPRECNRSGAYRDFNILQDVSYDNLRGDRFKISAWYTNSNRELPMLTTDYGAERRIDNRQREQSVRAVAEWAHHRSHWHTTARAGTIITRMKYRYAREVSPDNWANMTDSHSDINTYYAQGEGEYSPSSKWLFSANVAAHQHFVNTYDRNVIVSNGNTSIVGYEKGRIELSGSATARWQPVDRLGASVVLREEMHGTVWTPVIPALFVDGVVWPAAKLTLKGSISRNYRAPSLNDLYFMPGGNPQLRNEHGFTYDLGAAFSVDKPGVLALNGGVTWFDSRIDDWIIWLPTTKGFFSPRNVKRVHSYGIEARSALELNLPRGWVLNLSGSYSWTPSINDGDPVADGDKSVGKQLPYVPCHSASVVGHLKWRRWTLQYKWAFYSQRYTMSSNDYSITGYLPEYYMNNISLGKEISTRHVDWSVKAVINNLFDEDYLSVLSRPMPGINFEVFISITPRW